MRTAPVEAEDSEEAQMMGFKLLGSLVQLDVGEPEDEALLTLEMMEEGLSVPSLRQGVVQLASALADRIRAKPLKGAKLPTGTFYADVHTLDPAAAGGAWGITQPSYNFRERRDMLCEVPTEDLVSSITIKEATTSRREGSHFPPKTGKKVKTRVVTVTLSATTCAALAKVSGISGWAELWTLAGGRAVYGLWQPLRTCVLSDAHSAPRTLEGAFGLTLARVSQATTSCDAEGVNRLVAVILVTALSLQSLRVAMAEHPEAALGMAQDWQAALQQRARLPLMISQEMRSAWLLLSAKRGGPQLAGESPASRQAASGGGQTAGLRATRTVARPGARQQRGYSDDPLSFKWCSNCNSASHSLWDCFSLKSRVAEARAAGTTVRPMLVDMVQQAKEKWAAKGDQFARAFTRDPGRSVEALVKRFGT